MENLKKIEYFILFIIAYFLFSGSIFFYYGTPTNGKNIKDYNNPNKALVIIDLQKDCIGDAAPSKIRYSNEKEIINNTNKLISSYLENGDKVIYCNQVFSGFIGSFWSNMFVHGILKEGTDGTEVCSCLIQTNTDHFTKPKGDAFSNSELSSFLIENKINELTICGIDGEFCVLHTATGAINRGYKVSLAIDALGFKNKDMREKLYKKYSGMGVEFVTVD